MDFAAMPPEINSTRLHAGPGAGSLLAAAAAWDGLAADLDSAAGGYRCVVEHLAGDYWSGEASALMLAAFEPFVDWFRTTAAQARESASQARAAVNAFDQARAMAVHPATVYANRSQMRKHAATNYFGQNSPAIAADEAAYSEMWAQDAAAMFLYADTSGTAATLTAYVPPRQTTRLANTATPSASTVNDTQAMLDYLHRAIPQALRSAAGQERGSQQSVVDAAKFVSSLTGTQHNATAMPIGAISMASSVVMAVAMAAGIPVAGGTTAAPQPEISPLKPIAATPVTAVRTPGSNAHPRFGEAFTVGHLSAPSRWPVVLNAHVSTVSAHGLTNPSTGADSGFGTSANVPFPLRRVHKPDLREELSRAVIPRLPRAGD
ncbi:PPE family protein [Mycobacterium montefiorense]|uniref:PPE family protein n=1 Tax=Mycobacterium montefiorense TaxID=154654 RepID=UPI0021DD830F|nr:PPE family protein [Mycobacterium montefiorense]MCV7427499.1 PPE family protein [Mycobacterium montefiorense]GLE54289.1 PPE family protein [Mycobacterium montefiorense]